jgi:hypothetical protein
MIILLKMFRDLQMLLAAVTHLVEGLSHETLLTLKVEKSPICLVGRWKPAVSTTEHSILFLKMLIRNKSVMDLSPGIKHFKM